MTSLFEKTEFALEDIELLIKNSAEETTYLEFKGPDSFTPIREKDDEYRKREIGKDVSAFANSDGGILIYGLNEKKGRANKIGWIDSTIYSKGWLQQVIESNTSRPVTSLEIHPISNPDNSSQQIYVLKIQQSPHAPHMTKGGTYHRRNNHGNADMAEYEVRDMYNRMGKTNLEIVDVTPYSVQAIQRTPIGPPSKISHTFNFYIKNTGNSIEHYYKLEIHLTSGLFMYGTTVQKANINYQRERDEDGLSVHVIDGDSPIFQNDIRIMGTIHLELDRSRMNAYQNGRLKLRLFYSNGVQEKTYFFRDLIQYNSRKITVEDFN